MIFNYLIRHPAQCFFLMVIAGAGLGLITIDLYRLVAANLDFIRDDFWFAMKAGALWQFLMLLVLMTVAMVCYLVLRLCEHVLVEYFTHHFMMKHERASTNKELSEEESD